MVWMIALGILVLLQLLIGFKYRQLIPVMCLTFGLFYALLFCLLQLNQQLKLPTQTQLSISIDSLPKYSPTKVSFMARDRASNQRYLLSWFAQQEQPLPKLALNQIYQVNVNLKPPHGTSNGVGFDREKWLFRHGIDGVGNIKNLQATGVIHTNSKTLINQWRTSLSNLINQHFAEPRTNALIHALSIGDKSHFEQRDMLIFQNTGTAHLIAISGLHIGMVALLGWLLGGLIYKLSPKQKLPKPILQVIIGLAFALFYACLAGLAVSTQRAVIMLAVLGCYKLLRRPAYAWDVWSTSLLLVLLVDPLNVLDGGFWLSFTAVAVLIFAFNGQNNPGNKTMAFIKMQFTLVIGMLPLSLAVFSRLNLIAPAVNMLMIPLMTFLLIPALLLLLLVGSVFNTFPEIMVTSIQWLSQLFIHSLDWFNQFSSLALNTTVTSWWQYLLLILGSVWIIAPAVIPQRHWGLLLILLGLYNPQEKPPEGHFKAHFLDVGQGLSVIIQTQNHLLIYDVGAAYDSGFNMADAVLIPLLLQQQINHIDALVLSHQDNDHSGAANQLLNQFDINKVWGTEPTHQACLAGHAWNWDGVQFSFLSPFNLTPYLKNNSSCVLKVESSEVSMLLTGDIEEPVEYRLQKMHPERISADILLMPHHGSKTSSSADFIATVNPSVVINSSGQYNPFNHPADVIVERYQQNNTAIIDTQHSGLITLQTYPELQTHQYRQQQPRIWHKKKPD
jgi:competence protein ComEC